MSDAMQAGAPPTNVRWRILALLVAASFISYMLRYNMSTASVTMMADLEITEQQLGYILAAEKKVSGLFSWQKVRHLLFGPRSSLAEALGDEVAKIVPTNKPDTI